MKLAIVGATGLVGKKMIQVIEERGFQFDELIPVASARSAGQEVVCHGKSYTVVTVDDALKMKPDVALFSAGGSTSLKEAPRFAEIGCKVVDNSSAWRMDPTKKLVIPEVNGHVLTKEDMIIANPNCSTMQMVPCLYPIHNKYGIKRLVISTYQSFTGTGKNAVDQYESEKSGNDFNPETAAYNHPIFENCIPHCDVFLENGYTKEEMKLVHETRKILGDHSIKITATAVRVPVFGGHSESVNIEFDKNFEVNDVKELMKASEGIVLLDNLDKFEYPMPKYAHDKDEIFVGRIRRDESVDNGLNMWIVSDNLRKGAATNTIQIVEYLIKNELL